MSNPARVRTEARPGAQDEEEIELDPIDLEQLSRRVHDERSRRGMSLRAAADESGVPFNTFSRVERGYMPDLANFSRLAIWLGLDPGTFFPEPGRRQEPDTTETIRTHLHADPNLSDSAAEQIAALVTNLYQSLATPSGETELHLRADSTLTPEASALLALLLEQMQERLLSDPSLGSEPGWVVD